MDKQIPIDYANPERPTVSGRELHEFLQVGADYRHWFPRMVEYGFTEGEDFNPVKIDRVQNEGGRKVTRTVDDHQLTIPMAKELCMLQRNERGKQARRYFIAVEEQWNSPEAVMRRAILIADKKVKQLQKTNQMLLAENMELKEDAEYAKALCMGDNCRTVTEIAKDYGYSSAEKLNLVLHALGVQYKTSSGQWVLYAEHCGNAEISFSMNINLTGTPPTEEEMRAPATIKPEDATLNIPKPQEPEKEKPDQKKPKPEKKPAKKKEKQSEDSIQISLEGWF